MLLIPRPPLFSRLSCPIQSFTPCPINSYGHAGLAERRQDIWDHDPVLPTSDHARDPRSMSRGRSRQGGVVGDRRVHFDVSWTDMRVC